MEAAAKESRGVTKAGGAPSRRERSLAEAAAEAAERRADEKKFADTVLDEDAAVAERPRPVVDKLREARRRRPPVIQIKTIN